MVKLPRERRDTVNEELGIEIKTSTSTEEYLLYGDENIEYRLYNELDYTGQDNANINHDMEEDSFSLLASGTHITKNETETKSLSKRRHGQRDKSNKVIKRYENVATLSH